MKNQNWLLAIFLFVSTLCQAQSDSVRHVEQSGLVRTYMVYEPKVKKDSLTAMPLVICLHGYGDTITNFMSYNQMNLVSDTAGFLVAYPQARTNRAWNSGISTNAGYPTGEEDDVAFISAMIDSVMTNYWVDSTRIFCCGSSNGGFMSFKMACQLSNRICAIGSVGGLMSEGIVEGCKSTHAMPVIMIHGTEDDIVPRNGIAGIWMGLDETLNFWNPASDIPQSRVYDYIGRGKTSTGVIQVMKGTIGPNPDKCMNVLYEMLGGGHEWPVSETRFEIHASTELWRFFSKWQLQDGAAVYSRH